MLVLETLKTLVLATSELQSDASDEFEVVVLPAHRGPVVIAVLHDQAQVERLADGRGDAGFAIENPVLDVIHLWNKFGAFPQFCSGLEFVFAPFTDSRAKVT